MKKKTSVLLLLGLCGLVSFIGLSLVLIVALYGNYKWNPMFVPQRIMVPWSDLISFAGFMLGLLVSFAVIAATGTEKTKAKAVVLLIVLEFLLLSSGLLGSVVMVILGRHSVAYMSMYSRLNSYVTYARVLPSALQSLLLFFAMGRYYELQDSEDYHE